MKKITFNHLALFAFSILATLVVASCNNNNNSEPKSEDSSQVAAKENDAKFANKKQENDAQFLVTAAAFSLEEIQLGQLAQKNGSSAGIRDLGKMMAEQHTKILKEVTDIAKTNQVTIPDSATTETAETYKQLAAKTADDFNRGYCDRLVSQHKDAIAKFEKVAADSRNQDLKAWAAKTLPELRKHLDRIFDSQKKLAKV